MTQKKVLKVWQMVFILILLVAMQVTMFLPAFRFDGHAVGEMYSYVVKTIKDVANDSFFSGLLDEAIEDEMNQDDMQEIDDEIAEIEEERGINISSITPFRIMSHNLTDFMLGNDAEQDDIDELENELDDELKGLKNGYNAIRILFILMYTLGLIVIVLIVIGYVGKWNKFIPLIIGTLYGFISAVLFGVLRFGLMRMIAGAVTESLNEFIEEVIGLGGITGNADSLATMLSCMHSVAFVVALLLAVLIMLMCIVSMAIGNNTGNGYLENDSYSMNSNLGNSYGMDSYMANSYGMDSEGTQYFDAYSGGNLNTAVFDVNQEETPVNPVQSLMGQVLCTQGVAKGKGFRLPYDRKVVVGKNEKKANLVVDDPYVSNTHCSIQYNPDNNTYIVIDHSSNGTYVNGSRLKKDVPMVYPAGTVLCLANGDTEITLG